MSTEKEQAQMDNFFETRQYDEEVDWRGHPELGEEVEEGEEV